jgi:hypothetical protein
MGDNPLNVITSDKVVLPLPPWCLQHLKTLATLVDDMGEIPDAPIPVSMTSDIFKLVLIYLELKRDDLEAELKLVKTDKCPDDTERRGLMEADKRRTTGITGWEVKFLGEGVVPYSTPMSITTHEDLFKAASFLDFDPLVQLMAQVRTVV